MTGLDIATHNLTVRYRDTVAVDALDLTLAPGKIYGLLGRNGSGKTSLLAVLSAFRPATSGSVLVGGMDPFENASIMSQIGFVRDRVDAQDSDRVGGILAVAASLRPNWDADYAARLVERFNLPPRKRLSGLSRGMKSALSVTLGLAARTPLTIFDEAYLGLDAPSRYAFYDEVLNDYLAHPRTIILSTHLIEEVGALFEEVVILHEGRLVVHEETEQLRQHGTTVTGPAVAVDAFVTGRTVLGSQRLGGTRSTTIYGPLDDADRAAARAAGLELGPIGLQDLFVHLTGDQESRR
ncbi:ATP-binding cassette domain-containing protein [Solwaraspora sp. WMMB335]|uniref:ATP-binding cassette domain-containing protein n=1 Tax=Solwaraspora sp. WMMB335 TaxID=3404118 RepID=UPI003B94DB0A